MLILKTWLRFKLLTTSNIKSGVLSLYIKEEASPSIYADWVNGGMILET